MYDSLGKLNKKLSENNKNVAIQEALGGFSLFECPLRSKLRALTPGQRLVVDGQGNPTEIGSITSLDRVACFTISKQGEILIRDGFPSLNGTSYQINKNTPFIPITQPLTLPLGSIIHATNKFQIKLQLAIATSQSAKDSQKSAQHICEASVSKATIDGDLNTVISFGRSHQADQQISNDQKISRFHFTIGFQTNHLDEFGRRKVGFRVADGVLSKEGTYILSDSKWEKIETWQPVVPGTKIRIGGESNGVVITVPELEEDQYSVEDQISATFLNTNLGDLKGYHLTARGVLQDSYAEYDLRPVKGNSLLNLTEQQLRLLGTHIRYGMKLIREEKYSEAGKHFSNEQVLSACGYHFSEGNVFGLINLDKDEVKLTLHRIASRSWFYINTRTVSPSYGWLPRDFDPNTATATEKQIAREFLREVSLIYLEEWTHALQHATGEPLSRWGILFDSDANEYDAPRFFAEHNVPMSDLYLSRYDRKNVLKELRGFQTDQEIEMVKDQLAVLTAGQEISIGKGNTATIQINCGDRAELDKSLLPVHVLISRAEDGDFLLRYWNRGQHNTAPIFVPDRWGYFYKLEDFAVLKSGSNFRLGRKFELTIP